jgi:hypothetical protein
MKKGSQHSGDQWHVPEHQAFLVRTTHLRQSSLNLENIMQKLFFVDQNVGGGDKGYSVPHPPKCGGGDMSPSSPPNDAHAFWLFRGQ